MAWVERQGNRFRVRHRVNGKIATDSVHDTEPQAELRAKQLEVAAAIGGGKLLRDTPLTLGEWARAWLPSHLAGEATIAKYDSFLRNHILPVFADRPLDAIERIEIKAFVKQLKTKLASLIWLGCVLGNGGVGLVLVGRWSRRSHCGS